MADRDEARREAPEETGAPNQTANQTEGQPESREAAPEEAQMAETEDGDTGTEDEGVDMASRLKEAEAQAAEHWERLLRATAELENIRKRSEREVANAHRFALDRFIGELLPVVDSLELALKGEGGTETMREGVEMTLKQFLQTLEKFGVTRLRPEGERFDPEVHEAMTAVPDPEAAPETVLEVVQTGYLLNGRVVRPARVVVSKAPEEA